MTTWSRRDALKTGTALVATGVLPGIATAQPYPSKAVRVVVTYPPGGSADSMARLLFSKVSTDLGQQFVVENLAGGGGTIGPAAVARAPADGYSVLFSATDFAVNPSMRPEMPYDTFKDFQGVFLVGRIPCLLCVNPSFEPNSVAEMIAYGKARPGGINFASAGNGTMQHILIEMFARMAGIKVTHVPYKGGAPAMNDLLAGHVNGYFSNAAVCTPYIKKGALKALGVSVNSRLPTLPEVPPISDTLPGFYGVDWLGVFVRSGTPNDIVGKLNAALNKSLLDPAVQERMAALSVEHGQNSPAEFSAFFKAEAEKMAQIVKAANIQAT